MTASWMTSGTQVLVVGAGPVGLAVASELLWRGVSCRVIDSSAGPATTSRAIGIHGRTLELFRGMGIIDAIETAARGSQLQHGNVYEHGRLIASLDVDTRRFETPYPRSIFIAQTETEAALRERLARFGGTIEWGVTLQSFVQDATGVSACVIDGAGQEREIRADWLIGCDGGHSTVRKQLGLPFVGAADETWLVVDVNIDWDRAKDTIQIALSPEGTLIGFPFPEGRKWRILDTAPMVTDDPVAIAAHFARRLTASLGAPVRVDPATWVSVFTIQQRMTPHLRRGHCFLVGDAAHVHSPASGRGLNTGIQDAVNLTWKLALVIAGEAPDALLDSYDAEREPVAAALLRSALRSTRTISPQSALVKRFGARALRLGTAIPPIRAAIARRLGEVFSGFTINYRESPVVSEQRLVLRDVLRPGSDRTVRDWLAYRRAPHGGDRVPDVVYDGNQLFDALMGTRHTLLLFAGTGGAAAEAEALIALGEEIRARHGAAVTVQLVLPPRAETAAFVRWDGPVLHDQDGALHRRFGARVGGVYLVRPDWYVGFRSPRPDLAALAGHLSHIFLPAPPPTSHMHGAAPVTASV